MEPSSSVVNRRVVELRARKRMLEEGRVVVSRHGGGTRGDAGGTRTTTPVVSSSSSPVPPPAVERHPLTRPSRDDSKRFSSWRRLPWRRQQRLSTTTAAREAPSSPAAAVSVKRRGFPVPPGSFWRSRVSRRSEKDEAPPLIAPTSSPSSSSSSSPTWSSPARSPSDRVVLPSPLKTPTTPSPPLLETTEVSSFDHDGSTEKPPPQQQHDVVSTRGEEEPRPDQATSWRWRWRRQNRDDEEEMLRCLLRSMQRLHSERREHWQNLLSLLEWTRDQRTRGRWWCDELYVGVVVGALLPRHNGMILMMCALWTWWIVCVVMRRWMTYCYDAHDVWTFRRTLSHGLRRLTREWHDTVVHGRYSRQVAASLLMYTVAHGESPLLALLRYKTSLINRRVVQELKQAQERFRRQVG